MADAKAATSSEWSLPSLKGIWNSVVPQSWAFTDTPASVAPATKAPAAVTVAPAPAPTSPQVQAFNTSAEYDRASKVVNALQPSLYEQGRLFIDNSYITEIFKDRGAEKTFNAIKAGFPEQTQLIDKISSHPELRDAMHSALVKDPTVLKGLKAMMQSENGDSDLKIINKMMDSPEGRKDLATVFKNIADQDDITFEQIYGLSDAVRKKDPKMAKDSLLKLGFSEKQADATISRASTEAFKDMIKDPQMWGQLFRQVLGMFGIKGPLADTLAGFADKIGGLFGKITGRTQVAEADADKSAARRIEPIGKDVSKPAAQTGETIDDIRGKARMAAEPAMSMRDPQIPAGFVTADFKAENPFTKVAPAPVLT